MTRLRDLDIVLYLFVFLHMIGGICSESKTRHIIEDLQDVLTKKASNKPFINGIQDLENDMLEVHNKIDMNITQLIKSNKYNVEVHNVITPDGYVLQMFRIPGNGSVVFLMHGLISSADDWVSGGVDSGLAYLLAEQGFDVWMGNARGNKHSKSNIYIDPLSKKFWDFSFHEIGVIDVPTMIDFILEKTKKSSLIYIGHSQGTTAFFIMCSLRPVYNHKITLMIALSPVAWISHMKSPVLNILKPFYTHLKYLANTFSINELFQDSVFQRWLQKTFCGNTEGAFLICQHLIFLVGGFNYNEINFDNLPVIFNHFPSGSSFKQIDHFAQLLFSGYFRQFDYGLDNIVRYGSVSPPSYPVEKITAPVAIFYGEGDWLSDPFDVKILKSYLPNLIDFHKLEDNNFTHFDFVYAVHTKNVLLPFILRLIKKLS